MCKIYESKRTFITATDDITISHPPNITLLQKQNRNQQMMITVLLIYKAGRIRIYRVTKNPSFILGNEGKEVIDFKKAIKIQVICKPELHNLAENLRIVITTEKVRKKIIMQLKCGTVLLPTVTVTVCLHINSDKCIYTVLKIQKSIKNLATTIAKQLLFNSEMG